MTNWSLQPDNEKPLDSKLKRRWSRSIGWNEAADWSYSQHDEVEASSMESEAVRWKLKQLDEVEGQQTSWSCRWKLKQYDEAETVDEMESLQMKSKQLDGSWLAVDERWSSR